MASSRSACLGCEMRLSTELGAPLHKRQLRPAATGYDPATTQLRHSSRSGQPWDPRAGVRPGRRPAADYRWE
ncbi:hypothetical protein E4U53_002113 [Claviceps sorghi]|nr:hypothetical protein E4U53_002113 [Claviceps sorghi]